MVTFKLATRSIWNYQARIVFPEKTKEFFVDVEIIANMITINLLTFLLKIVLKNFPFEYKDLKRVKPI